MINHIHIKNFKSLKDVSMEMSNLNLLTGINGVGKSSLIEALLLLKQSYSLRDNGISKLILNDDKWTEMGVVKEILCKSADEDKIEIAFQYGEGLEDYIFDCSEKEQSFIDLHNIENKSVGGFTSALYELQHFRYLSADRISPETSYPDSGGKASQGNLGKKGDFSIEYINKFASNRKCKIAGFVLAKGEDGEDFPIANQIDAWMSFISPNIKVRTQYDAALNRYKLSYKYGNENEFTPKHVGFGITYTLPVVTAILISEPGDLVIIENPEAHLHPRAQSKLGELMAIAAQGGVQLIIETHSDHILNGVRVATKQNKIEAEKVKIYYYAMNMQEMVADFYQIPINQEGIISYRELRKKQVQGFFDQINTDTDILLDIH